MNCVDLISEGGKEKVISRLARFKIYRFEILEKVFSDSESFQYVGRYILKHHWGESIEKHDYAFTLFLNDPKTFDRVING